MKRMTILTLTLFLIAALAVPAFAHGKPRFKAGTRGWKAGTEYCARIPDLTSEQSAKIEELRDRFKKEILPLKNDIAAKRRELGELWSQPEVDEPAIRQKQKEIRELRREVQDKITELRIQRLNLLTPEQRAQLKQHGPRKGYESGPGWKKGRGFHGNGKGQR